MGCERDGVVAGVSENSMEKTGRRLRSEWQRIGNRARLLGGRAAEKVCAPLVSTTASSLTLSQGSSCSRYN